MIRDYLRIQTFSAYDLQKLRMQCGLRLCANFRNKLKVGEGDEVDESGELSEKAEGIIDQLKNSYKTLTEGVARNRTLPAREKFVGDELISEFTELVLVQQYLAIEANEKQQFRLLVGTLDQIPIYDDWLRDQSGIGPAMAAVLISYFDPHKADHVSDFWAYCGLDVALDGRARSRRAEHLIDRAYTKADGTEATRKSVTYNPWLKSRLLGALATSLMRTKDCPWAKVYYWRRHRLETDPNRVKATNDAFKKMYKENPDEAVKLWTPMRIHRSALRYMVKMLLLALWRRWRALEGLEVTPTYHEKQMGHVHDPAAWEANAPWANFQKPVKPIIVADLTRED